MIAHAVWRGCCNNFSGIEAPPPVTFLVVAKRRELAELCIEKEDLLLDNQHLPTLLSINDEFELLRNKSLAISPQTPAPIDDIGPLNMANLP